MKLLIEQYIESRLVHAAYEYDEALKTWVGVVETVPGVYAQADTLEEVRTQLAEVLEEHLIISLHQGVAPQELGREFKNFHVTAALAS